ncbi:MAG: hypothetical protein M0R80_28795 [Proteobacteria bacterium]|jgi:hypothetical protein|nr:hypothetical protein [Pseudomonadota bacterium]
MRKIRIFDIKWDTTDTGNESDYSEAEVKKLGLPSEFTVEVDDDFDPENECSDILSDELGFCVFRCSWEVIAQTVVIPDLESGQFGD